ncbi:MAG: hypothetical protein RMY28_015610 [Nostoc sp. ChiSLP01]|nr:hypothetical protein [Nostoc sp. CmiSLP01]MDZ8283652.1 hypothetical protein [Nostoc sp. ChiSLP01]
MHLIFFNEPPSLREASANAQRLVREERQERQGKSLRGLAQLHKETVLIVSAFKHLNI